MLRPATPLTVLLSVAFILLLLSVLSTPVVKSIPLGSFRGVDFGVFGFCNGSKCSDIKIGYATDSKQVFGDDDGNKDFDLPTNTRSSLSSILIIHPVAAFFTLICLILAASTHLHSPSHSPRYLLALLILLLPTLLVTLLAFLVDILLFVPHLAWGSWLVMVSTILITTSGVLTCAMRRTLVSRKARKKRIAENPEMNGENYYSRQNAIRAESPPPLTTKSTTPMVNGAPGSNQLPAFATFDANTAREMESESMPLNTSTPSNRGQPNHEVRTEASDDSYDRYTGQGREGPEGMRGGRMGLHNGPRDEFGHPLPSSNAFGPAPPDGFRRDTPQPGIRRQYSNETMSSQNSRGRGRGGYPSRGYGRVGPYGPGRGGFVNGGNERGVPIGATVGGPGAGIMAGQTGNRRQEGQPPGYGNSYPQQGRGFPLHDHNNMQPGPSGAVMYGRDPSVPNYGRRPSPGPPSAPGGYRRQPSPGPHSAPGGYGRQPSPGPPSAPGAYRRHPSPGIPSAPGIYGRQPSPGPLSTPGDYDKATREPSPGPGQRQYRARSPPPPMPEMQPGGNHVIGQAIEMDAYTGSPSHTPSLHRPMQLGPNDDAQQSSGLKQQQEQYREPPSSLTGVYSGDQPYVPPRAAWAANATRSGTPPHSFSRPLSPIHASPVELPGREISHTSITQTPAPTHVRTNTTENYYEDVDPRFADPSPPQAPAPLPPSLMLDSHTNDEPSQPLNFNPQPSYPSNNNSTPPHLESSASYESIQEGARSTAASDASNFTSVSQRGINPNWAPPPGVSMGGVPNRRPQQQQSEIILQTNPDFELPSSGRGGMNRRGESGGRAPAMGPAYGERYLNGDT